MKKAVCVVVAIAGVALGVGSLLAANGIINAGPWPKEIWAILVILGGATAALSLIFWPSKKPKY